MRAPRSTYNRHVSVVRLVDRGWAAEMHSGLSRDSTSLKIVCPFITERVLTKLLHEHQPGGLRVVTRFNLADFASGVSDIGALRSALDAGGQVRGLRGLHSKVFIFGSSRAVVTSANLTSRGLDGNREFGCVSEQREFIDACTAYFDEIWAMSSPDVTYAQLQEWQDLVDHHLDRGGRPAAALDLPDFGAVPPAAPVRELPEAAPPGWPAESPHAFVKFFGQGHNRLFRSAASLDVVDASGCHWACTYPRAKRPRAVRDGATLFVGRLVRQPNDTMIFGRVIGRAHRPGVDEATTADIEARPFKNKWPNYIRVHHGEFVAGILGNGVSLGDLMTDLKSDSFASTRRNARRGSGNTDPRKALRQQAHVQLTPQAAAWLTTKLEEAFAAHGTIPADTLDELDWPPDA